MTLVERALELVPDGARIGLGSGRAAHAFVRALGERVRSGSLTVRGVPTSSGTEALAKQVGVPLVTLDDVQGELDITVDGADEVDPRLDLIKGYGRALVREKIVAACSRKLVILAGPEKRVTTLGARGRLPVEVLPFALPLCLRRLPELGCRPTVWAEAGRPLLTDNGNHILDCALDPIADARDLEWRLRAVPGVVGTGLFLGMADVVIIGQPNQPLLEELRSGGTLRR